ncbi:MAG TPA: TetR/AcrR family transcriptional regulator [Homoserinimonas sp.]|nr:TetR/AcrR family transcriptional regulator [Homoserinimonas sp.]
MANRRELQADATRAEIVAAARELFLTRGYVRTSLTAVAELAGVAVQTIYNSIGNKAALLAAVLDQATAGPDAPRSVSEFMQDRTDATGGVTGLSRLLADWIGEVNERSTEILALIHQTAAVYPEVAALERERGERRLNNYGRAVAVARSRGGLTSGPSEAEAAAAIWSLGHPQIYRSLVVDGDWTPDAYREWLTQCFRSVLS